MPSDERDSIQWSAPTHLRASRSNDWYWTIGTIALCGAVASVLFGNVLFAVIIVLATIMIGVGTAREPRTCEVEISPKGILIDREMYPYDSIRAFWIQTEHLPIPKLFLSTTGIIHPHIALLLEPPAEAEKVRAYLKQYAEEETRHSIGTIFASFLGI